MASHTPTRPPNELLTSIFSSLPPSPANTPFSPPTTPSEAIRIFLSYPDTKNLLLTLHCIYPDQLLPALDLLERGKISQHSITDEERPSSGDIARRPRCSQSCYYVEASSQRTSRFSQMPATRAFYEVRTQAWNCSCPAFTFSALEGELLDIASQKSLQGYESSERTSIGLTVYGGLAGGDSSAPICKHLLACLLASSSTLLAACVDHVASSEQEVAGWAAGWTA